MSDPYYAAVLSAVWHRGGDPSAVSRLRVEMCEATGTPVDEIAAWELEMQQARAQVERDMARLHVVSK